MQVTMSYENGAGVTTSYENIRNINPPVTMDVASSLPNEFVARQV